MSPLDILKARIAEDMGNPNDALRMIMASGNSVNGRYADEVEFKYVSSIINEVAYEQN